MEFQWDQCVQRRRDYVAGMEMQLAPGSSLVCRHGSEGVREGSDEVASLLLGRERIDQLHTFC